MKSLESQSFQFKEQQLPQKLSQLSQTALTGYWLFEFPSLCGKNSSNSWYLGLCKGQIIFSGNQQLNWQELLKIFKRYIPRLQQADFKTALNTLEQQCSQEQSVLLTEMLHKLQQLTLVSQAEMRVALQVSILSDFDTYFFSYPGQAKFISCPQLNSQAPLGGFEFKDLLSQSQARQTLWHQINTTIPSLESVPIINHELVKANLTSKQQLWLKTLTANEKTLNEIASVLAQDSLEVAKIFANLISKNFVKLKSFPIAANPEIFVVDDSPLILKQFESLVKGWGYSVRVFEDPASVLQAMKYSNPSVFCLDINMPGLTGFDLVKQIRRQPQLASVPIIMLTAEQTLNNNWRAKWSGCQFLNKPLTPQDVPKFKNDLRTLLAELLVLEEMPIETHLGYQS